MIQHQTFKPEKEQPAGEESQTSTPMVKNTALLLSGQNFRLRAKNGPRSKTPGLHSSAARGDEAAGRPTAAAERTRGAAAVRSDLPPLPSPVPDRERAEASVPPRPPLRLAPLELPEEVREAQWQKIKGIQKEDESVTGPVGKSPPAGARLAASAEPVKDRRRQRSPRARLVRAGPVENRAGSRRLEDVVCRGVPVPMCAKPTPPSPSVPAGRAPVAGVAESTSRRPGALPAQDVGGRRPRLRRGRHLEEDQGRWDASTGGLPADGGTLARAPHSKGQRAEQALREAGRTLETAVKKSTAALQPGQGSTEVSGLATRRSAGADLQGSMEVSGLATRRSAGADPQDGVL